MNVNFLPGAGHSLQNERRKARVVNEDLVECTYSTSMCVMLLVRHRFCRKGARMMTEAMKLAVAYSGSPLGALGGCLPRLDRRRSTRTLQAH